MGLQQRNTKKQGDVGLGSAIGYFTEHGHTVCIPLTDSQDYDLIVDMNGNLAKIQVKTSTCKKPSGGYEAQLRVNGGNRSGRGITKSFDPAGVDFIYVLTPEGKYLIPSIFITNIATVTVGGKSHKQFAL